jgi:hypothetical protein
LSYNTVIVSSVPVPSDCVSGVKGASSVAVGGTAVAVDISVGVAIGSGAGVTVAEGVAVGDLVGAVVGGDIGVPCGAHPTIHTTNPISKSRIHISIP